MIDAPLRVYSCLPVLRLARYDGTSVNGGKLRSLLGIDLHNRVKRSRGNPTETQELGA